jgi:hypothetical protein
MRIGTGTIESYGVRLLLAVSLALVIYSAGDDRESSSVCNSHSLVSNVTSSKMTWTERDLPGGSRFYFLEDVAYGNGTFVAVGEDGTILTSPDGEDWKAQISPARVRYQGCSIALSLNRITYGNGLFVAVGPAGNVLTSRNGVKWAWVRHPSGTNNWWLSSVFYGNGTFVAVGWLGTVLTSRDGTRWVEQDLPKDNNLSDVTYGNGLFVAVGTHGILTSPDGTKWTHQPSPKERMLTGVAHGNGTFVAVGIDTVFTSP